VIVELFEGNMLLSHSILVRCHPSLFIHIEKEQEKEKELWNSQAYSIKCFNVKLPQKLDDPPPNK
jgi:hypothetical protein